MSDTYKISDESVKKSTGKDWDEWVIFIDKEGGEKMTHKEIAKMLLEKKFIKKPKDWPAGRSFNEGWWCQSVTVGYEYKKGRRKLGDTTSQGIEIGVSKTFNVSKEKLWDYVMSDEGIKIWLGDIKDLKLEPKFYFQTSDGIQGEIRTIKEGERVRLVYMPKDFKKPSVLQLYFENKGKEKSSLGIHNEKLKNLKCREQMKKHWERVLLEIKENLSI